MMRAGLTLMELVVGLVITGVALTAGYSAYATVSDRRAQAILAMESTVRQAVVRNTLADWLREAWLTTEGGGQPFIGADGVHDSDPDDELVFLSTVPGASGRREVVISIAIDRDDTTREKGLVATIHGREASETERIELVPNAVALDTRYLYGSQTGRWLPSWISSSSLPRGVELAIGVAEGDSLPPLLQRPIRVALGAAQ